MDAHEYYRIVSIQQVWRQAIAEARTAASEAAEAEKAAASRR
jgi:hypothetical protein